MLYPAAIESVYVYYFLFLLSWFLIPLIIRTKELMKYTQNRQLISLNIFCCLLVIPYVVVLVLLNILNLITYYKFTKFIVKLEIYIYLLVFPNEQT